MGISLISAIAQHKEMAHNISTVQSVQFSRSVVSDSLRPHESRDAHPFSMVRHIFISVLGETAILISFLLLSMTCAHLFTHPVFIMAFHSVSLVFSFLHPEAPDDQSQYK